MDLRPRRWRPRRETSRTAPCRKSRTMFKVIKGGGAAVGLPGDMPSWSDGLSDPEIHDLVVFIHTFCKKK
jgi:hypothetical protein